MLSAKLRDLLKDVRETAGPSFTGIGVIVAADRWRLPIAPLRPGFHAHDGRPLVDVLAEMSIPESEFHDGFHVLSPDFRLELVSQYFAPPVSGAPVPSPLHRPGARYMTALLGSRLPGVLSTGVASWASGVAIFDRGLEVVRAA